MVTGANRQETVDGMSAANETAIFAHLYRRGSEPLNVPIRLRRVPCIGEFVAIEGEPSWWKQLGIPDDPGSPHHFEVLSVTHVDLNAETEFEAEVSCRYVTVGDHGKAAYGQTQDRSREPEGDW
jgi:hypothetical protein